MGIDWLSIIIGILALSFGIYTLITRIRKPEQFGKLEAMKKQYGEKAGYSIHLIAYSIVPIALGIFKLTQGVLGF
jgi:hypothetical protein